MYQFLRKTRAYFEGATKLGRNDPRLCGSGKKFKKMLRRKPPLIATSPETTEKNQSGNRNTKNYRRDDIHSNLATQSARI